MARITVEDCLVQIPNRFALVRLAAVRAKQLLNGQPAVSEAKGNKTVVAALREIAAGKVRFAPAADSVEKSQNADVLKDSIETAFTNGTN